MARNNTTVMTFLGSASETTASLTVAATQTYFSGQIFGSNSGTTAGPGSMTFQGPMEPGGAFSIDSIILSGLTTAYPMNVWLFNAPIASVATNGMSLTLTAADQPKFITMVPISGSDYVIPPVGPKFAVVKPAFFTVGSATTQVITGYLVCNTTATTGGTGVVPMLDIYSRHLS